MVDFNENTYYDELINNNIVSEEAMNLVIDINGFSIDTLDDILYACTGNRDWGQYCEETGIANIFETDADEDDEY